MLVRKRGLCSWRHEVVADGCSEVQYDSGLKLIITMDSDEGAIFVYQCSLPLNLSANVFTKHAIACGKGRGGAGRGGRGGRELEEGADGRTC